MKIQLKYKAGEAVHVSFAGENSDYRLSIREEDGRTSVTLFPKRPLLLQEAKITLDCPIPDGGKIFVNGYQSWTDTREFDPDEDLHSLDRLPQVLIERFHLRSYGDSWFRRYKKGVLHGYTFAYVRDEQRADLFGSLNEEHAFLIIAYRPAEGLVTLESDCKDRRVEQPFPLFDFVRYVGETQEVLRQYFSLYGTCSAPLLRGYTSWYLNYQDINEEKMLAALAAVDSVHFDLFQIDDGYETFVGDWMDIDREKFPKGLRGIADRIHAKGLKAGIWLAPFVCEQKSRVFREHPEWVYRRQNGEPVMAGSNWSGFMPLDIRKREVREYIRSCLTYYMDAGFDFFKLDFLYAAAMIRSTRFTRAEIMRTGMRFLRQILKDRLILGCGVPLSSAFGLVDYCRIGPDVSLTFDDLPLMRIMHRERVSTKQTLQNTIYRSCMDGTVFRCDPDVFLLRDDQISLSAEQRRALVTLNHLCGSVSMTSDQVGEYDEEKRSILREAQKLMPAKVTGTEKTGDVITVRYLLDGKEDSISYHTERGELTREPSRIFGNPIDEETVRKAEKKKESFVRRFGDDSQTVYHLGLKPIEQIEEIRMDQLVLADTPLELPENAFIVGNIRMGFGHYRIAMAIASCAQALGYHPVWFDLASFDATGSKMIRSQSDRYSMGSKLSQKSRLFNRTVWKPINSEGFRKLTYNVGDQENARLLVPLFQDLPKDVPYAATHVWPSQGAVHAGLTHVVNVIPDNWPMGLHLSEGAVHTVQTRYVYLGYKTLNGMAKETLKPMPDDALFCVGHYVDHELADNVGQDCSLRLARLENEEPVRFLLTVGGAGAGADLYVGMTRHLLDCVQKGKASLWINFGDHADLWNVFKKEIPGIEEKTQTYFNEYGRLHDLVGTLDAETKPGVMAVCNDDIFEAVYSTNLLMRKCDVLVTKPSELSFYPVPKLMMRHIGGHEVYGAVHAQEIGDATFECQTEESLCAMIDTLICDRMILAGMNRQIMKLKSEKMYDGGYEVVRLAVKGKDPGGNDGGPDQ